MTMQINSYCFGGIFFKSVYTDDPQRTQLIHSVLFETTINGIPFQEQKKNILVVTKHPTT